MNLIEDAELFSASSDEPVQIHIEKPLKVTTYKS